MSQVVRPATRTTATVLGLTAGVAGIEHGIFELLQGNTAPAGWMIASMGPPCVPEQSWNACEPALTVVPNFLLTGLLAVLLGSLVLAWSVFFLHRPRGGRVLALLSILLLLFGGGFFPPLIGLIAAMLASRIHKPIDPSGRLSGRPLVLLAPLWPGSLALYVIWVFGQFVVGALANEWLLAHGYVIIIMVLGTLALSTVSAHAHDLCLAQAAGVQACAQPADANAGGIL